MIDGGREDQREKVIEGGGQNLVRVGEREREYRTDVQIFGLAGTHL